jgi:hypothetical protein
MDTILKPAGTPPGQLVLEPFIRQSGGPDVADEYHSSDATLD